MNSYSNYLNYYIRIIFITVFSKESYLKRVEKRNSSIKQSLIIFKVSK